MLRARVPKSAAPPLDESVDVLALAALWQLHSSRWDSPESTVIHQPAGSSQLQRAVETETIAKTPGHRGGNEKKGNWPRIDADDTDKCKGLWSDRCHLR